MDLAFATTAELTSALRDRTISSRELLAAALDRIERLNPALNAVVSLDVERAHERAAAADEASARDESWGPLHGLPMTIKDVWDTEGLVTTSGAPELRDRVPARDAVAVARLRAAGAVIVGKTNTPMYAADIQTFNDVYGVTNNPWDVTRSPGGSSGGAAAAVAAGFTPFELGSDIGGSIRGPAHFCGVYGLKPTWGIVPTRGYVSGPTDSLVELDVNCAGPLARSVTDLASALDILAGPLDEDAVAWRLDLPAGAPVASLEGLRIGVVMADQGVPLASEVAAVIRGLLDRVADAGANVREVVPPVPVDEGAASWRGLVLPIMGSELPDELVELLLAVEGVDDPDPSVLSAKALVSRYRDWARANEVRQRHRLRWAESFEELDLVLAPVMPVAAFPHDPRALPERTLDVDGQTIPGLALTNWVGWAGTVLLPIVVVPAGRTPSGLPVGVQLIGPYLQDRRLLRMAELVDATGEGFVAPPGY